METADVEVRFCVPTYNAWLFEKQVGMGEKPEFGEPMARLVIRPAAGLRVVLGTYDFNDQDKPDIQIERQPNGWVIFLHPLGGGDPSGLICFHDDGRSFLVKEYSYGTPAIEIFEPCEFDQVPGFAKAE